MQCIWRVAVLQSPLTCKRRRLKLADGSRELLTAEYAPHVWAIVFKYEHAMDAHRLKLFTIVDEYCRLSLAILVGSRFMIVDVIDTIE